MAALLGCTLLGRCMLLCWMAGALIELSDCREFTRLVVSGLGLIVWLFDTITEKGLAALGELEHRAACCSADLRRGGGGGRVVAAAETVSLLSSFVYRWRVG